MRALVFTAILAAVSVAAQDAGRPIEAKLSYQTGESKVELLGVCKASETEISCWGPDGKAADPEVERNFRAALSNQTVSIRFGMKNRVAIFKITNPANPTGSSIQESMSAWDEAGSYFNLSFAQGNGGAERTSLCAVVFASPASAATGKARATVVRFHDRSERFPLKVGSSFSYLGRTYKVARIEEHAPAKGSTGRAAQRTWSIGITFSPATKTGEIIPNFTWTTIDNDGLAIRSVDSSGKPVLGPPNLGYGLTNNAPDGLSPAWINTAYANPPFVADDVINTNIDPAKIKEAFVYGTETEPVMITDIPLDPSP
jgi:hypothetical protein